MLLGMELCLGPSDFVLDGDAEPLPQKGAELPSPIVGPFLLWPNGWMHQDATWYGCWPQPRGICVIWRHSPLPPKKGRSPSPIFGPFPLWSNGSVHQDATWYGCWPQRRGLCVRWRPSLPSPNKGGGAPSQFSAHFYCAQTAGCIKMPPRSPSNTKSLGLRSTSIPIGILMHPAVWPQ